LHQEAIGLSRWWLGVKSVLSPRVWRRYVFAGQRLQENLESMRLLP
jgi:hypothetical protein